MTTSKLMYIAAVIVPFGFVILAGALLAHALYKRHVAAKEAQAAPVAG